MMLDWFALSLLCAIAVATTDAITKGYMQDYRAFEIVIVRFGITGLLMLPLIPVFGLPSFNAELVIIVILMLPCEIVAMLLYMKAIRDYPLSLTLPYLAFTPVIITICAYVFLGEEVSASGFTGIILVVAGGYLLNITPSSGTGVSGSRLLAPFRAVFTNHGSRLMLGVAFLYSITAVLGKAALNYAPPLAFASFYFVLLGTATLILAFLIQPRAVQGSIKRPVPSLIVALFMFLMVVTHFSALQMVETAYMLSIKRTSLLFGMLYGAWLFGERHLPRHLLAGSLMVLGVFFIYYSRSVSG